MKTFKLDIVSAEKSLFNGAVQRISVSGLLGDLGIEPGHTPLLSPLKPGQVLLVHESGVVGYFYISGGILEVQADHVTILADTCIRGEELDESAAEQAKQAAKEQLDNASAGSDYSKALSDLAQASAQLRMIKELKNARR